MEVSEACDGIYMFTYIPVISITDDQPNYTVSQNRKLLVVILALTLRTMFRALNQRFELDIHVHTLSFIAGVQTTFS